MKKSGVVDKKIIGLLVLAVVAIGLMVVVVVFGVARKPEPDTGVVEQGNKIDMEEVREKVFAAESEDIDKIISIYQEYIDKANSDEKVGLYNERIQTILQLEYGNNQYGKQVIDDTIAIDDILQTVSSAAQVINAANEYGENELAAKYVKILQEREAVDGVDIDATGGRG